VKHRSEIRASAEKMDAMYRDEAAKIEELKKLEAQRAQMMEKAEITAALIEKVPRWALLAELTMRMPSNMRLSAVTLKSKRLDPVAQVDAVKTPRPKVKSLTDIKKPKAPAEPPPKPKVAAPKFDYSIVIAGSTQENNEIADYISQLKKVPMLDKVELMYIRDGETGGKKNDGPQERVRVFEISAVVRTSVNTEQLGTSLRELVVRREAEVSGRAPVTAGAQSKEGE
jgi:Tfp pilus assembly protein PilN